MLGTCNPDCSAKLLASLFQKFSFGWHGLRASLHCIPGTLRYFGRLDTQVSILVSIAVVGMLWLQLALSLIFYDSPAPELSKPTTELLPA